mgnify:CR=1 FL=1
MFLRGANVGGHRVFRPRLVADALRDHGVVNIGAAGSFVALRPASREKLLADLRGQLPFAATIATCSARDAQALIDEQARDPGASHPYSRASARDATIRFVSILCGPPRRMFDLPAQIPADGPWLVRIDGRRGRLVHGVYRRQMKAISGLGQVDRMYGVPATTRSWSTLLAMLRACQPGPLRPERPPARAQGRADGPSARRRAARRKGPGNRVK